MTLMVRIMSLLPFATGSLCLLLVLVSFFGFASGEIEDEIPALPCVGPQEECATGMSESDLDVPTAFLMLDVHLEISMELDENCYEIISKTFCPITTESLVTIWSPGVFALSQEGMRVLSISKITQSPPSGQCISLPGLKRF